MFAGRANCSAFSAKPRKNSATAASARAAGFGFGVRTRHADRRLSRVPRARGDGRQEQRPAGDRLAMAGRARPDARRCSTNHRTARCSRAASRQRARSCVVKPPQPHWFFISSKMFSSVAAIAIELAERRCLFIERSDENRVFVDLRRLADLGERQLRRAGLVVLREPHGALHTPPQHDRAPLPAPALQPNRALLRLKALTRVDPVALARASRSCA